MTNNLDLIFEDEYIYIRSYLEFIFGTDHLLQIEKSKSVRQLLCLAKRNNKVFNIRKLLYTAEFTQSSDKAKTFYELARHIL